MILILKYSKKREGFKIEGKKQRKNGDKNWTKLILKFGEGYLFSLSLGKLVIHIFS